MPQPGTCPSNANKHPGQIVLDTNRVQRPREVVAAEKGQKAAKASTLDNAHKQIAAREDTMAVEQNAQLAGPGWLVRPKPFLLPKKTAQALVPNLDPAMTSATWTLGPKTCKQVLHNPKYYCKDLPFGFDLYSWRCGSNSKFLVLNNDDSEWREDVDATEEFDDQMIRNWAGTTVEDVSRGKKCTLSDSLEEEEEREVQDDPEADEDAEVEDVVDNMDDDVKMTDWQQPEVDTKMSVDIAESDEKPVKTESRRHTPAT
ncbi:hypothetical protein F4604DRAFT_1919306 [Suillus subluteus]|nr:hypothetical protein F4604DRAFT_1919306 [Suillus subluteus]